MKFINSDTLDRWKNNKVKNMLGLDVRTREEFEMAHIADSRHAREVTFKRLTCILPHKMQELVLVDDKMVGRYDSHMACSTGLCEVSSWRAD